MEASTFASRPHLTAIEGGLHGALWEQVEIGERLPGGYIEARVPIELIRRDEVPVDQHHVDELAVSIADEAASAVLSDASVKSEDAGQLSRVVLGHIPGEDNFRIIDGFHRDAAFNKLGRTHYNVVIRPDCTLEKIIDLRILTATTHATIAFSRIIEWVEEAWAITEWSSKVSATQAFSAAALRGQNCRYFGIDADQFAEMKDWVTTKCEQWHVKSPMSIYKNLSIAKIADPELVKRARNRKSGHELEDITPAHLGAIAKGLPNRFDEQKLVSQIAIEHNLTVQILVRS